MGEKNLWRTHACCGLRFLKPRCFSASVCHLVKHLICCSFCDAILFTRLVKSGYKCYYFQQPQSHSTQTLFPIIYFILVSFRIKRMINASCSSSHDNRQHVYKHLFSYYVPLLCVSSDIIFVHISLCLETHLSCNLSWVSAVLCFLDGLLWNIVVCPCNSGE